jgi:hypothetical protein
MYLLIVVLLLLVCPSASVVIEAFRSHETVFNLALIGRWWTFWAVGVRLFTAGIRQVLQPRFTAEDIFNIHDKAAFSIVREVGSANLAMGTLGICSVFRPGWVVAAAMAGGIYYGCAGLVHLWRRDKNIVKYIAMVSDGTVSAILATFVLMSLLQSSRHLSN